MLLLVKCLFYVLYMRQMRACVCQEYILIKIILKPSLFILWIVYQSNMDAIVILDLINYEV